MDQENQPVASNEELDGNVLVKRKKVQFFKFWPKAQMQTSWRNYIEIGETQDNLNAAYFAVQVLDKVIEQFVLNQIKKKNAKEAQMNKLAGMVEQPVVMTGSRRGPAQKITGSLSTRIAKQQQELQYGTSRGAGRQNYAKYFEPDSDSEDDYDSEEDIPDESQFPKSRAERAAARRKGIKESSSEEEESVSGSGDESSESEEIEVSNVPVPKKKLVRGGNKPTQKAKPNDSSSDDSGSDEESEVQLGDEEAKNLTFDKSVVKIKGDKWVKDKKCPICLKGFYYMCSRD